MNLDADQILEALDEQQREAAQALLGPTVKIGRAHV